MGLKLTKEEHTEMSRLLNTMNNLMQAIRTRLSFAKGSMSKEVYISRKIGYNIDHLKINLEEMFTSNYPDEVLEVSEKEPESLVTKDKLLVKFLDKIKDRKKKSI